MSGAATKRKRASRPAATRSSMRIFGLLFPLAAIAGVAGAVFLADNTVTLRSPVRIVFQSPLVIAARMLPEESRAAQADQSGHRLTAFQQYACNKFGSACRLALAVQRAENPRGECEIYHYNSDGTLDWGYFQINTVHLKRPGVNLRALLDCKANIDFAYRLYTERGFEPWTTYRDGAYRKFLSNFSR
jgi:hypothetical protein